ncbi:hypothetical protein Bca101_011048 [Brassica carinata]
MGNLRKLGPLLFCPASKFGRIVTLSRNISVAYTSKLPASSSSSSDLALDKDLTSPVVDSQPPVVSVVCIVVGSSSYTSLLPKGANAPQISGPSAPLAPPSRPRSREPKSRNRSRPSRSSRKEGAKQSSTSENQTVIEDQGMQNYTEIVEVGLADQNSIPTDDPRTNTDAEQDFSPQLDVVSCSQDAEATHVNEEENDDFIPASSGT